MLVGEACLLMIPNEPSGPGLRIATAPRGRLGSFVPLFRLTTRPDFTMSPPLLKTMGIVDDDPFAASAAVAPSAKITDT
jgi:hypothetical protein